MFIKIYTRNDFINAMNAYNTMQSFRKAAKQTGISKSTIHRWLIPKIYVFDNNYKFNLQK